MPLPVIDGVARVTFGGVCAGGSRWSNTWHGKLIAGGPATDTQLGALLNGLGDWYTAQVLTLCSAATTLTGADVTPLDGTTGAIHFSEGTVGFHTENSMPAEVAMVLTLRTAARGRRARGRIYLPPFSAVDFDVSGHLAASVVNGLVSTADTMRLSLNGIGWELGVASYGKSVKLDHTVHPARRVETTWPPFFTPLTGFSMDGVPDVIRNRKL